MADRNAEQLDEATLQLIQSIMAQQPGIQVSYSREDGTVDDIRQTENGIIMESRNPASASTTQESMVVNQHQEEAQKPPLKNEKDTAPTKNTSAATIDVSPANTSDGNQVDDQKKSDTAPFDKSFASAVKQRLSQFSVSSNTTQKSMESNPHQEATHKLPVKDDLNAAPIKSKKTFAIAVTVPPENSMAKNGKEVKDTAPSDENRFFAALVRRRTQSTDDVAGTTTNASNGEEQKQNKQEKNVEDMGRSNFKGTPLVVKSKPINTVFPESAKVFHDEQIIITEITMAPKKLIFVLANDIVTTTTQVDADQNTVAKMKTAKKLLDLTQTVSKEDQSTLIKGLLNKVSQLNTNTELPVNQQKRQKTVEAAAVEAVVPQPHDRTPPLKNKAKTAVQPTFSNIEDQLSGHQPLSSWIDETNGDDEYDSYDESEFPEWSTTVISLFNATNNNIYGI